MKIKFDGIACEEICERAGWHRATAIEKMIEAGVQRGEADSFADYIFSNHAVEEGGVVDPDWEDSITDEQWERMTLE